MKTILNKFIAIVTLATLSVSCVNENYINPDQNDNCDKSGIVKNKEVLDVYAIAIDPSPLSGSTIPNTPEYLADDVVEAVVISNDKGGNFYKNLYLQPIGLQPLLGNRGIIVSVDLGNIYNKLEPGRKVFVKIKGLHFANSNNFTRGLILGTKPTSIFDVDRIPETVYGKFIIKACQVLKEDDYVRKVTLAEALNDNYINTLIEIKDVQFKTDCAIYSKPEFDTSLKITSGGAQTLDLRTSKFAKFAGNQVPSGRGTIRGVLGKYNNGFQLIIRNERDVKLTEPRIETPTPALVGSNLVNNATLNETFESYAVSTNGATFPKFINDATIGFTYWNLVQFPVNIGNKYIQMSAFNNGCSKSYFIIPVDFTAASGFSFKTKDGYNNGNPMKVYYSKTYVVGGTINPADLVDITSSFDIADGRPATAGGYASNFTNSKNYQIPASLTGNGFFILEYDGTNGTTTTIQIDDIVIQ